MLTSAGYLPDSVANLQVNTLADGAFHAATLRVHGWRPARPMAGATRAAWSRGRMVSAGGDDHGMGIFNVVEGIINHYLLGIHHVRDDVPAEQKLLWDLGFLLWGLLMLAGSWWMTWRNGGSVHA